MIIKLIKILFDQIYYFNKNTKLYRKYNIIHKKIKNSKKEIYFREEGYLNFVKNLIIIIWWIWLKYV